VELKAVCWAWLGWPWHESRNVLPSWDAGHWAEPKLSAARHWELCKWLRSFLWKTKCCSSKPISNVCKVLCKQHLKGVTCIAQGSERACGQAGLVPAATWGCQPGWPHSLFGTGERAGKVACCCCCYGCWESQETTVLGRAGKTWKCGPWGLIPENNPALKKKGLLSSVEYCCIALAIMQQRKKN